MTFSEYRRLPGITASGIKAGARSMRHMRHELTRDVDTPTAAMRWGTLVHVAILEPNRLGDDVKVWPGRRAGKAWDEFCVINDSSLAISAAELGKLLAISRNVWSCEPARRLIDGAATERTHTWDDGECGQCKARLDAVGDTEPHIVDLKTTTDISPRGFARKVASMGYLLQLGWYARAVCVAVGRVPRVYLLAVESREPYDVAVYEVAAPDVLAGQTAAVAIARRYRDCELAGAFPGQCTGVQLLDVPDWALCEDGGSVAFGELDEMEGGDL